MIPTKTDRDILRSGTFQEQKMGIAKGSEAWIFNILRNSTYTDKIGSPMREYIANALDEHQKLGKSHVPVEVTFPTAFSNELHVRDFGTGLSDEDVVKFFANYGASDKRESNDLIGAFGIGCKSAFAYTDSFTIVSYHKGVKTTFNMYIDETDIGSIAKMQSTKTTEPDGIDIIIPVKPQDVSTFQSRGLALMKYFKTQPLIKGIANVPDFTREASPVSGNDWKYFGDNRGSVVIQGQIGYPIDISKLGQINYYAKNTASLGAGQIFEWEHALLTSGLEIEVAIGDVEVTASRESLQMTPKTIKAIREKLQTIRDEITDLVTEKFKSAKTLVEAKTAYYNFFQRGGGYGRTLQNSVGAVTWNGIEIKDSAIRLTDGHRVMQYTKKYNGDILLTTFDKIMCSDDLHLYYDDTDRKAFMYRRRAKTLLDAGAKQVTVLQTDDIKAFKKETGLDVTLLPKYSTVTPTVLVSTRGAGSGVDLTKRVKHKVKVFELDWTKLQGSRVRGARSEYWKVAEIEPDTQLYIPIDRFEPDGVFDGCLQVLQKTFKHLGVLGIDLPKTPVYGVKKGQKVGNMVRLDTWVSEQVAKLPNLADEVAVIQDWKTHGLFDLDLDASKLKKGTLAKQYATEYAAAKVLMDGTSQWVQSTKVEARLQIAKLVKLQIPNAGKLLKLSNEFAKHYPMMQFANSYDQRTHRNEIVEYLALVDEAR